MLVNSKLLYTINDNDNDNNDNNDQIFYSFMPAVSLSVILPNTLIHTAMGFQLVYILAMNSFSSLLPT